MADAYTAGLAFRNVLAKAAPAVYDAAANVLNPVRPIAQAAGPTVHDFLSGVLNGPQNSVTVKLPAATPAPAKAPNLAALGTLSPAAAAVLGVPGGAVKAPAAAAAAAKAADPMAGLGNLSFRQLLTLGDVTDKTAPRGVAARAPSSSDTAGGMLNAIYQSQFQNSLKAAGNDPAKQQAAVDAFEKKVLPIALKGNTADDYIYGQPGAQ